jgi:hypothetical protein
MHHWSVGNRKSAKLFLWSLSLLSRVQSGFLRFDANWAPEFLPIPFKVSRIGYNDLRGPMNQGLQPVSQGRESAGVPLDASLNQRRVAGRPATQAQKTFELCLMR